MRAVSIVVIGLMVSRLLFETIGIDMVGSLTRMAGTLTLRHHGVIVIGLVLLAVSVLVEYSSNTS